MNVLLFDLVVKHKVVQTFTCDRARYHRSGKCGYIRRPTGHLLGLLGLVEHGPEGELHDLVWVGSVDIEQFTFASSSYECVLIFLLRTILMLL